MIYLYSLQFCLSLSLSVYYFRYKFASNTDLYVKMLQSHKQTFVCKNVQIETNKLKFVEEVAMSYAFKTGTSNLLTFAVAHHNMRAFC